MMIEMVRWPSSGPQHQPLGGHAEERRGRHRGEQRHHEGGLHRAHGGPGEEGAQHHELAGGEVDDPGGLVDHHEAHGDERVDAAGDHAGDQQLEQVDEPLAHARLLAQVGADHLGVALDLVRRARGDPLAEGEHGDAVAQVHHHAHVVLDEHDRDAPLLLDVEDEAGHVLGLLLVHAGHRLVEEQDAWPHGQRAGQVDPLLQPVGQAPHRAVAQVLDLQEVDDLVLHLLPERDLLAPCPGGERHGGEDASAEAAWAPSFTLSRTVIPSKRATFWKVRARPSAARRSGATRVTSRRRRSCGRACGR